MHDLEAALRREQKKVALVQGMAIVLVVNVLKACSETDSSISASTKAISVISTDSIRN